MNRPIVFITIAYSLGIIAGKLLNAPLWCLLIAILISSSSLLYAAVTGSKTSVFLLVLFALAGAFAFQISGLIHQDGLAPLAGRGVQAISGYVADEPKYKENGVSLKIKPDGIAGGEFYVWLNDPDFKINYGDNLKLRGELSEMQTFANPLLPRGMKSYRFLAIYYEPLPGNRGSPLKKIALGFSREFNGVLTKILPPREAALLGSILLGTTVSPLDDETKTSYRRAGLIHLLVASGTQVSILIGVCLGLMRSCRLPDWSAILATSLFNLLLVVVTGGGASILRAAIMGEVMLIGLLFERQGEIYTTLAFSALVLIIADPNTLFDLGFQLSFAATWALVYIAPVLGKKMPQLLAVTLAPLLATTPIVAYNFSQVTPGGIIANLLVIPWVEFLTVFGFVTTVLGFFFLPLAQLFGNTLWLMLVILERIARLVPALPGACFYAAAPSLIMVGGFYAGLILMVEFLKKGGELVVTRKRLAFALLIILPLFVWDRAFSAPASSGRQLTVTFLDVGQGDSALIELPDGKKVLIDGGGLDRVKEARNDDDPIGSKVVVPFLQHKGINRLDLVILTHPHADHLGGLNKVLAEIKVDGVLDGGQADNSRAYERFKELIAANRIKYALGRAGQVIDFGPEVKGYILNPSEPLLRDTNSDSIVMRLVYGEVAFLFTGDLGFPGEERVLSLGSGLRSTVLKVGHHGSATSSGGEFLRAVAPRYAVVSVGARNRYRHPTRAALERLAAAGAEIYRTDLNGAIEVKTDGRELAIETMK
ncbi:MAG: DNA internalization-related competence protein ComEC/Rec2 [Candidatus Saganbacteria bacterium]|nr:DNA internalization-related competence protein ComEC/Rec2 [Candidatus Saganbacteria bacterium]